MNYRHFLFRKLILFWKVIFSYLAKIWEIDMVFLRSRSRELIFVQECEIRLCPRYFGNWNFPNIWAQSERCRLLKKIWPARMSPTSVDLVGPKEEPLEAWLRYWHDQGLVAVLAQPIKESWSCRLAVMARQIQDLTMPDTGNGKTEVDLDHTTYSGLLEI